MPFGATGRAFGGQMVSSRAKLGTKSNPNLSQNVIQHVTKSKAEIRSNFGCDSGAYLCLKNTIFEVLAGLCDVVFAHSVDPLILHTLAMFLKVFLLAPRWHYGGAGRPRAATMPTLRWNLVGTRWNLVGTSLEPVGTSLEPVGTSLEQLHCIPLGSPLRRS